jgi:outer membrane protein W
LGLELSQAFKLSDPRFEPYVAVSVNYLDLKFQVDALYSGIKDETLQLTDGFTVALSGGLVVSLGERWSFVGEVFYSPLGVVRPPDTASQNDGLFNIRGMVQYRLR